MIAVGIKTLVFIPTAITLTALRNLSHWVLSRYAGKSIRKWNIGVRHGSLQVFRAKWQMKTAFQGHFQHWQTSFDLLCYTVQYLLKLVLQGCCTLCKFSHFVMLIEVSMHIFTLTILNISPASCQATVLHSGSQDSKIFCTFCTELIKY